MKYILDKQLQAAREIVAHIASRLEADLSLLAAGSIPVRMDAPRMQRVFSNLFQNAFDAVVGEEDPVVRVRFELSEREIITELSDNGPGIPAEQVDTLFEPLNTSRPDGIGLGLSICKTILQAHGGRIWLSSSAPGQTEFKFALPVGGTGLRTAVSTSGSRNP